MVVIHMQQKQNNDTKILNALVTGASRGIGRAIALGLAKQGHRVVINYRTHPDEAQAVADLITNTGGKVTTVMGDVADKTQVKLMFEQIEKSVGGIDILINNAGIVSDKLLIRMRDEDFQKVIDVNLMGSYYCAKAALPNMMLKRWGRIVNISSVVGIRGNAGQANYAASKSAINGFTRAMAREVAKRNITVNAVAPGYVKTATSDVLSDAMVKNIKNLIPLGRFGTTEEIAPMVVFLTTEQARYITGQVICVDGGLGV